MAIPATNVLGNPNVTEGNFQIAIEQLRESVIGSGKAYDAANTYSQYDTCVNGGIVYYSKINSNTGNTPAVNANWGLASELIKLIASPTANALAKINSDGTIGNSNIVTTANGDITTTSTSMPVIIAKYDGTNYVYTQARNTVDTTEIFLCLIGGVKRSAILANGTFQSATNVYGSTSDAKLKENVVDTSPKLEKLMKVKVRNFNYINQEDSKQIGVIAQEIEEIFPSVVFETKDTKQVEVEKEREKTLEDGTVEIEKYTETETQETGEVTKNVKYSVLYMIAIKAMQEQQEIINDLKARIEILERK